MSSTEPKQLDPRWTDKVTDAMKEAIKAKAVDGKITCAVLRKFAEDNGVDYIVAGTAADLAGVRVHNCGLGCF
jgi:pentose-5-phosphate-3-epimerase